VYENATTKQNNYRGFAIEITDNTPLELARLSQFGSLAVGKSFRISGGVLKVFTTDGPVFGG